MFAITALTVTGAITALEGLIGDVVDPVILLLFVGIGITVVFKLFGKGRAAVRKA